LQGTQVTKIVVTNEKEISRSISGKLPSLVLRHSLLSGVNVAALSLPVCADSDTKLKGAAPLAQYKGTVKWFNNAKGYGFLGREGPQADQVSRLKEAGQEADQTSQATHQ
jgi:'Cold-shock' DNA-binding domain